MPVNLVTVTGNLETLVGGTPTLGRIWFRLNRPDWNGTGQIFAPEYIEAIADTSTGAFSAALQSTTDLEAGAYYSAILKYREALDGKDREYEVASFLVPTGGPFLLADLLNSPVAMPIPYTDHVYTFAEVEAWTTAFQPSYQYIVVNEDGYYVPYERDLTGASTDLTTTYGEAFIKRGLNAADLATLAADVANSIRQNATSGIGVYGGTANAITLNVGSGYAVIPTRYRVRFRATATNTGAATVAVDGLPAVALRTVTGVALPAGYIRTDVDTEITFDGTYWVADRAAERGGTNDSGFERFANGSLHVWKKLTGLGPISSASGSLFSSSTITVGTLAADFLTGTVPSVTVQGHGTACWAQGIADPVGGVGSTGGTFGLLRATTSAATTFKADCEYWGNWF